MIAEPDLETSARRKGFRSMAHSRTAVIVSVVSAIADAVAVLASFAISYQAYRFAIISGALDQNLPVTATAYVIIAVLFTTMTIFVFWYLGMYTERASVLNLLEIRTALKGLLLTAAFLFASLFFLALHFSRIVVVGSICLATILVIVERRFFFSVISKLHMSGKLGKRVLIYGAGDTGRLVMKKIVHAPHLGATVVGFLDDFLPPGEKVTCSLSQHGPTFMAPVLGAMDDLEAVVGSHGVNELLVAMASTSTERLREIFELAQGCGIKVAAVPHLGGIRVDQLKVDDLSAIPILRPFPVRTRRLNAFIKRIFDIVGSVVLGILTIPIWVGAAVLIRLEGPGPILFSHERVGQRGKRFKIIKFRTMKPDVDPYAFSPHGDMDDPRITSLGRFLRNGGLDELPQLLNVLRGDMSLVGPRPEMPFIVEQYSQTERLRLSAKPGLTGLWQISADRHAQIHENIEYDLYYINHQSVLLDVVIILETMLFTLGVGFKTLGRKPLAPVPREDLIKPSPYILVALDPRTTHGQPNFWRTWMAAVHGVSWRWPVKILEPSNNGAVAVHRPGKNGDIDVPISRVEYRNETELRALVTGAQLLITDMKDVKALADEAGIEALLVLSGPGSTHSQDVPARRISEVR